MRQMTVLAITIAIASISQAQSASSSGPIQGLDHMQMDHAAHMAAMTKEQQQAEVSKRGKDVMPFELLATLHTFTKDAEGGIQQVTARDKFDAKQASLVRQHLKNIQAQFLAGDFSGPGHIHGEQMPGLAELEAAKPGQITIAYKEIKGGAQLAYHTADPMLVAAIHEWFDAQVSDHGKDAVQGHTY